MSQLSQVFEPADKSAARWASPIDSSEPRIVAEEVTNSRPSILKRNDGMPAFGTPLPSLTCEVDPVHQFIIYLLECCNN